MTNGGNSGSLTWARPGDLYIAVERERNYRDFLSMMESMNPRWAGRNEFCVLAFP